MGSKVKPFFISLLCLAFSSAGCRQATPIKIRERAHGGVDLETGLYVRRTTDLALSGSPDLMLTRTYRNRDDKSRPFGVGTSDVYDEFLVGEYPKWIGVVLADGAQIRYVRRSGEGMVFENSDGTPGYLYSTLEERGRYWHLKRLDGSEKVFLSCDSSSRPLQCGLVEICDKEGRVVKIERDSKGNATRIRNDIGWIKLKYDDSDRVTTATASTGESVRYFYDPPGRLIRVEYRNGNAFVYEYDGSNNMTKIVEPGMQIVNAYDASGYGVEQQVSTGWHFRFAYELDQSGKTLSTKVTIHDPRYPAPATRIVYFDKEGWINKEVWEPETGHSTTAIFARDSRTGAPHVMSGSCKLASREVSLERPEHSNNVDEVDNLRRQCLSLAEKAKVVKASHASQ